MVTVQLAETTWKRLQTRKNPGDTYDDIVVDLLNSAEQTHEHTNDTEATQ